MADEVEAARVAVAVAPTLQQEAKEEEEGEEEKEEGRVALGGLGEMSASGCLGGSAGAELGALAE